MELLRALGALVEPPDRALAPIAAELGLGEIPSAAEHTELFSFQLPPYGSIYLDASGMLGGEARDRIAGFWRALGVSPPDEPDHLTTLLASFGGWLEAAEAPLGEDDGERWRHRARAFLGEHLLSWVGAYLVTLRTVAAPTFYRRWASLLAQCLARQSRLLSPPADPSTHHRATQPLESADGVSPESLASALLTPVRSGLLLTRSHLADAARTLGLAGRMGERRYMLEALLRQDPGTVRDWLLAHARSTLALYAEGPLASSMRVWSDRVETTAHRLARLGRE